MLYHLLENLEKYYDFPGSGLYKYLSFRAGLALMLSLLISTIYGKRIISFLQRKQIGETVRDLGLSGQNEKAGTPTMGGIIIILATLIPVLLLAKLDNVYTLLLIITTVWMGTIGFIDDYIKTFRKNKEGLKGRFKVLGQIGLGIIVGATLYFNDNVTIKNEKTGISRVRTEVVAQTNTDNVVVPEVKSTKTTIPFVKNNEFDYADLIAWTGDNYHHYVWLIFIPTFAGALVGFLWYNTYPAQVFMGDTGSLTIGGIIAVIAIAVRKELLIPVLCGIFLIENLSVILQVAYFKHTKKKYGEGKRIFLMSPLHHHYQKKGYHESKIVMRFLIVGIFLAVISIVTLKIR